MKMKKTVDDDYEDDGIEVTEETLKETAMESNNLLEFLPLKKAKSSVWNYLDFRHAWASTYVCGEG